MTIPAATQRTRCTPKKLSKNQVDQKVNTYLSASISRNTKQAYQSDVAHFIEAGGSIPATPQSVANYLAVFAELLSVATLSRRIVAISREHAARSLASPTKSELVTATLRGIRRLHGCQQRQVAPLLKADLVQIVKGLNDLRGMRDKALLLIGFAGAFRRSELVAIQMDDVRFVPEGAVVRIRRSKTDQDGHGHDVAIPYVKGSYCPVRALAKWIAKSGIESGAVFRRINRYEQVLELGITPQTVALIIKQRVADAGMNPQLYSGHSLRAGLVTDATRSGANLWKIRQQTHHKSDSMLQRYIRDSQLFVDNAAGMVW